jgi:hypothetical protein
VAKLVHTEEGMLDAESLPADGQVQSLVPLLLLVSAGALSVGLMLAGVAIWLLVRSRKAEEGGGPPA